MTLAMLFVLALGAEARMKPRFALIHERVDGFFDSFGGKAEGRRVRSRASSPARSVFFDAGLDQFLCSLQGDRSAARNGSRSS